MAGEQEYQSFLTEFIQKQMVILGPNIALDIARRVLGLEVSENGEVLSINGDLEMIAQNVLSEFEGLSGKIAKTGFLKLFAKYPGVKQP